MSTNVNRLQDIAELDPMTFEQLDQATQIENNDIFVIDQPDATRKVLYTDVKTKILSEDGSNLTVNYDVVDTVENIAPGETIGTMFKKISSWFISKISQLGTLAFKDKVSESDLDSAYISTITGHLNDTVLHSTSTEKELWNDKYTKAEIDEKLGLIEQPEIPVASTEVNGLMSKESVVELSRLGDSVSQLNSDLINRFECGNVDITGKSGEWVFVTVNYSYPHENIPFVVASHGSAEVAQCACTTRYRTTTGFQIGVYNTTAHTQFNWIAIEP